METARTRLRFSQKHPFLFGSLIIMAAVVLVFGIMAASRHFSGGLLPGLAGDRLGLVRVEGLIDDSVDIVDWIKELREDDSVRGVLLRVDSPGGAVGPSQEIYRAVQLLAAKKPVVASMGTVAASGGYYSAAPATVIVANPGTLTASIGVLMEYLNVQQLADKWGIRQELLASGRNKGAGSPFKDLTPEQRQQLMGIVMDLHNQFVDDVALARDLPRAQVQAIADGRALTGRQALDAQLVDRLGGQEDAFSVLRELTHTPEDAPVVEGPPDKRSIIERYVGSLFTAPSGSWPRPRWVFRFE